MMLGMPRRNRPASRREIDAPVRRCSRPCEERRCVGAHHLHQLRRQAPADFTPTDFQNILLSQTGSRSKAPVAIEISLCSHDRYECHEPLSIPSIRLQAATNYAWRYRVHSLRCCHAFWLAGSRHTRLLIHASRFRFYPYKAPFYRRGAAQRVRPFRATAFNLRIPASKQSAMISCEASDIPSARASLRHPPNTRAIPAATSQASAPFTLKKSQTAKATSGSVSRLSKSSPVAKYFRSDPGVGFTSNAGDSIQPVFSRRNP